jgi:hypothetical protein
MSIYSDTDTVLADYDDAPTRPAGNHLIRLVRAAGAFLTILMAVPVGSLFGINSDFASSAVIVGVLISVASIPLIMVFWSKEVRWKEGWLSILTIAVVSILTWFVEFVLSVLMAVVVYVILR